MPLSMPIAPTRIMIPAPVFLAGVGSPNAGIGATVAMVYWALDPTTQESMWAPIDFPDDWQSFNTFLWTITLGTTATGGIRVQCPLMTAIDGQTANSSVGGLVTVSITGGTTNRVQRSALETLLTRPPLAAIVNAGVIRVAADGADTYAADIGILGLEFTKAS